MRIIDICEGFGGATCLKQYYLSKGIKDYMIYPLGLSLSVGDIINSRIEFLRKLYNDNTYSYINLLSEIINNITNDTKIRIWSSKKNDDDYMLLLFLCNFLKDKTNKISVIFSSDYEECTWSINALDYKEIDLILKYEMTLSGEEIQLFSNQWNDLVKLNSELRILEDGKVKNKSYCDYYEIILNNLKEKGPCTIANLIADCMINRVINDAGDLLYLFIIDQLVDQNKIKIIKKESRHFIDIIDLI